MGQPAFCLSAGKPPCLHSLLLLSVLGFMLLISLFCIRHTKKKKGDGRVGSEKGAVPQRLQQWDRQVTAAAQQRAGNVCAPLRPPQLCVCGGGRREAAVCSWEAFCLLQMPLQIKRILSGFS